MAQHLRKNILGEKGKQKNIQVSDDMHMIMTVCLMNDHIESFSINTNSVETVMECMNKELSRILQRDEKKQKEQEAKSDKSITSGVSKKLKTGECTHQSEADKQQDDTDTPNLTETKAMRDKNKKQLPVTLTKTTMNNLTQDAKTEQIKRTRVRFNNNIQRHIFNSDHAIANDEKVPKTADTVTNTENEDECEGQIVDDQVDNAAQNTARVDDSADKDQYYDAIRIDAQKLINGKMHYKVVWTDSSTPSWEPLGNVSEGLLNDFYSRYTKAGTKRKRFKRGRKERKR